MLDPDSHRDQRTLTRTSHHTHLHNPNFLPGKTVGLTDQAVDFADGMGDLGLEVPGFLFLLFEVVHPFGFFAQAELDLLLFEVHSGIL